ncbi:MAG TPA: single-stranded-DNA-specific exonuclease RecJ, partial [Phycisphaeraceae bacterium]|nr:single-stranded-DNA-specific exonuclease RecJ [Phycisphaeraceae bacterium]
MNRVDGCYADPVKGLKYRWTEPLVGEEVSVLSGNLPPLLSRLLRARGIETEHDAEKYLYPRLNHMHDPLLLPDMGKAAERLVKAVRNKERIVIYGDYDVDGVTSTAILYHAICCADPDANVRTYVPHRLDEGYGLNDEAMRTLAGEGTDLLVTVDCGISAVASAQLACDLGMDLIITDHHSLPGDGELPPAYARVHPRLPGSQYPFGDLCGAGVAFKLAWSFAVVWCGNERVSTAFRELLLECLPLAALGTVADVVPLLDENRTIVSVGLSRIRQSRLEGVQALINVSDLKGEKIDSYKVGFVLGPRLNACGRMGHAKEAIELLTTAKGKRAEEIANRINNLNKKRQQTERQILNTAVKMAEEQNLVSGNSRIIALAHEDWHPGVVGIVCSRMVDRYRRPTILMGRDGDICTGSARSIPGFSIYDALAGVSDNLLTYGGHEMAAG